MASVSASQLFSRFKCGCKCRSCPDADIPEREGNTQRHLHCCPPLYKEDGLNPNDAYCFPSNYIRTTNYTMWTFVPFNLFRQFRKASNIYFLATTIISLVPGISPIFPITTILPLLIVVGTAMLRDAMDDFVRFRTDRRANDFPVLRVDPYAAAAAAAASASASASASAHETTTMNKKWARRELLQQIPCKDLNVGDIVLLQNRQEIPADCVIICTANDEDGTCYVETANLDGETNLKMKIAKKQLQQHCRGSVNIDGDAFSGGRTVEVNAASLVLTLLRRATISCDAPNASLLKWQGRLESLTWVEEEQNEEKEEGERFLLFDMDSLLLRGCLLRNVEWVIACVVYAGVDTKMALNLTKSQPKLGRLDKKLNSLVLRILMAQQVVLLLLSIGSTVFRQTNGAKAVPFVPFMEQHSEIVAWLMSYCTFFILLSVVLPISLFVSLEFCRVVQARFMEADKEMSPFEEEEEAAAAVEDETGDCDIVMTASPSQTMKKPKRRRGMRVRTTTLHEELSQVEYIFSDKTGTLTENEMRPARVFVAGSVFDMLQEPDSVLRFIGRNQASVSSLGVLSPLLHEGCNQLSSLPYGGLRESSQIPLTRTSMGDAKSNNSTKAAKDMGCISDLELLSMSSSTSLRQQQQQQPWLVDDLRLPEADGEQDPSDVAAVLGTLKANCDATNFLRLLASCNTVTVATFAPTSSPSSPTENLQVREWMSSSPDELALVSMAAMNGVRLVARCSSSITLDTSALPAHNITTAPLSTSVATEVVEVLEVLEVLPFTPERKMMSIVLREKGGAIHMYTKGADSSVLERIQWPPSSEDLLRKSRRFLEKSSMEGLRTLVCAERYFTLAEFNEWRAFWRSANLEVESRREAQIHAASLVAESRLTFLGCSAIEDRLQGGVPETIEFFIRCGIIVWVLSGDKRETAVNIAGNSGLFNREKDLILHIDLFKQDEGVDGQDAGGKEVDALTLLQDLAERVRCRPPGVSRIALVVDGRSMEPIHESPLLTRAFMDLVARIDCAVCCRMTPLQKALVVLLFRDHTSLAVGDGANDVSMIQAASVGVGIIGREGSQAERASDYAVHRFRHLPRLLAVHGRYSLYRNSRLIQYSFYKNLTLSFSLCFYGFYNGFTGSTMFDSWQIMLYNTLFTLLPPLVMGLVDYDLPASVLLAAPRLYHELRSPLEVRMSRQTNFVWFCLSAFHGWVVYYGLHVTLLDRDQLSIGVSCGMWGAGTVMMTLILFAVTMQAACSFRTWTWLHAASIFLSLLFYIVFLFVYGAFPPSWNVSGYYGEPSMVFGDRMVWICWTLWAPLLLACTLLTLLLRHYYFSNDTHRVQLLSCGSRRLERRGVFGGLGGKCENQMDLYQKWLTPPV